MRKLLAVLSLLSLMTVTASGEDPKPAKDPTKKQKPGITLKVGDAAPALKASKWLQGEAVKAFEPGKIYVVEFWATWCGPCIVMMPHLSELQAEYKDKGVTIIGFSAKDPNNSEAKVTEFVKKRGSKLKYTFAYADDRDTYDAWMRAAGRNGIPCSFVVDRSSKIAYIGHPMYLDVVMPKVIDGTWNGKKSLVEIEGIEKEVTEVFKALRGTNPEASLKTLQGFETRHPALSKIPYFIGPKITLLVQARKPAEARKLAEEVLDRAIKQDNTSMMRTISATMRTGAAKEDKGLLALSLKAAEAMVKAAGEKDALALFNLAEAHLAIGDKTRAKEIGNKAAEAADTPALKRAIEQRVKAFDTEKKGR
jgi:thiol-disulfide isomerase/thioredoxin